MSGIISQVTPDRSVPNLFAKPQRTENLLLGYMHLIWSLCVQSSEDVKKTLLYPPVQCNPSRFLFYRLNKFSHSIFGMILRGTATERPKSKAAHYIQIHLEEKKLKYCVEEEKTTIFGHSEEILHPGSFNKSSC